MRDLGHDKNSLAEDTVSRRLIQKPRGWIMGTFADSRCVECDEEKFFDDGSRCARCLGLSYGPIDEQESEDNAEESSRISLELLAAA